MQYSNQTDKNIEGTFDKIRPLNIDKALPYPQTLKGIMMKNYNKIDTEDFRIWVEEADDYDLSLFIDAIKETLLELEADDFFGTEGLNKRFA